MSIIFFICLKIPPKLSLVNDKRWNIDGKKIDVSNLCDYKIGIGAKKCEVQYIGGHFHVPKRVIHDHKVYTITQINKCAFFDSRLHHVTLPSTIETIEERAFKKSSKLTTIDLSKTKITTLPTFCFAECDSLYEVSLPITLEVIAPCAFKKCDHLSTITLESSCAIGEKAFSHCLRLSHITCSKISKYIGPKAFYNTAFSDFLISKHVTSIGDRCFKNCYYLSNVQVEAPLEEFPSNSFLSCVRLESITFPSTLSHIGECAFKNTSLKHIVLYENLKSIDEWCFSNCPYLQKVDLSKTKLEILPKYSFFNCPSLKTFLFSKEMRIIEDNCIRNTSLSELEFPESLEEVKAFAFFNSSVLSSISFLSQKNLIIGSSAFENCVNLQSISFLGQKCSISLGSKVFCNTALIHFDANNTNILEMNDSAFALCSFLSDVSFISSSFTKLSSKLFYQCRNLKEAYFPSSLEIIGDSCFFETGISSFSFCDLTNSYACLPKEEEIITLSSFPEENNESDHKLSFSPKKKTQNTKQSFLKFIGENSFLNCHSLVSVDLNNSLVNEISPFAFYNCSSLSYLVLPDGLTKIGSHAFSQICWNQINFPLSLEEMGSYAFFNCTKLRSLLNFEKTKLEKIPVYGFALTPIKNITLPKTAKEISKGCFYFSHIISIELDYSLQVIGESCFENCQNLVKMNDLSKTSIEIIGNKAFKNCMFLSDIILPNTVKIIGEAAFFNCSFNLKFTAPKSLTELKKDAFALTLLNKADFSQTSVTSFPEGLFMLSLQLQSIIFPNVLERIGSLCFFLCPLNRLFMPMMLEKIETNGICWCPFLIYINLSRTKITYLPKYFCSHCHNLEDIRFPPTLNKVSPDAIYDCPKVVVLSYRGTTPLQTPDIFSKKVFAFVNKKYKGYSFLGASVFSLNLEMNNTKKKIKQIIQLPFAITESMIKNLESKSDILTLNSTNENHDLINVIKRIPNSHINEHHHYLSKKDLLKMDRFSSLKSFCLYYLEPIVITSCAIIYGIAFNLYLKYIQEKDKSQRAKKEAHIKQKKGVVW